MSGLRRGWWLLLLGLLLGLTASVVTDASEWGALRRAESYRASGDFPAAERSYDDALRAAPDDPTPALRLADLYRQWGRPRQVLAMLDEAQRRGATADETLPLRLRTLAQLGAWDEVLQFASRGNDALALSLLTQAHLHRGECGAAADAVARWRAVAPDDAEAQRAWRDLHRPPQALAEGKALLREQRWGLAYCVLAQAVVDQPAAATAHAWYGESAARLGLSEVAQRQFRAATRLAPGEPLGWLLWGTESLRQGDWEAARIALLRAQRLDPANPAPCLALAEVKAGQGRYSEVNLWIDAALERAPADPAVWKAAARFYLERNLRLPPYPLKAALGAVRLSPDDAESHTLLGWAYLLAGDLPAARAALDDALALAPDDAEALALRERVGR